MPLCYCLGFVDENTIISAEGYSCGLCLKEFAKNSVCRRHVREIHLKLGTFACPHCGKMLTRGHVHIHAKQCTHKLQ